MTPAELGRRVRATRFALKQAVIRVVPTPQEWKPRWRSSPSIRMLAIKRLRARYDVPIEDADLLCCGVRFE